MGNFFRSMFGGSAKAATETRRVLSDPTSHITAVSANYEFGVVRIVTDLERSDRRHAKDLADMAEAIGEMVGHPARAIAPLNEVQLTGVPPGRMEVIERALKDISRKNAQQQGKLTPRQSELIGFARPEKATMVEMTLPRTGEPVTVFKVPLDTAIRKLGQDSQIELAGLVDTLLKEKGLPVTNVAYDAAEGGILRVHVRQQKNDAAREQTKQAMTAAIQGTRQFMLN